MPIKPLNASTLSHLMERIEYGKDGQFRSITPHSPTSISIRFSVQDKARGFDWIDLLFRIDGVRDAKLVSDHVLGTLDLSEGITVEQNGLAIGDYSGRLDEAPMYIIGTSVGYEELSYSD